MEGKVKAWMQKETDLTPFFTQRLKKSRKIQEARLVEREDGSRKLEIKFYDNVPKTERNITIIAIGNNLVNMCDEMDEENKEENEDFLEFMNGLQIKEWKE